MTDNPIDKDLAQAIAEGLVEQQAKAIDWLAIGQDLWASIDGAVDLVALARKIAPMIAKAWDEGFAAGIDQAESNWSIPADNPYRPGAAQ